MIRWAVAGIGSMAGLFLKDSANVTNGHFVACYSRDEGRANEFAKTHQLLTAYDNYAAMLASSDIDAVYLAGPHQTHASMAIQALEAGKHVLIEKPMAISLAETKAVFAAAKANQRFCCEALWSKFSPTYQQLVSDIKRGRLGEPKHIQASFGFAIDLTDQKQRLINPDQAGGALLDIGIYPIFMALDLFGVPEDTQAIVQMGDTGVDIATDLLMKFSHGRSATLSYRLDAMMSTKATVSGTHGWVELETPFFSGNALHWQTDGVVKTEHVALKNRGWGLEFEAINTAIAAGKLEADEHTWANSLELMGYLDWVRQKWGPIYPFE